VARAEPFADLTLVEEAAALDCVRGAAATYSEPALDLELEHVCVLLGCESPRPLPAVAIAVADAVAALALN